MSDKKATEVSWIGEIPLEWELKKIKRVFKTTNGYGFPDKLQGQQTGDIPFLKVSDFPKNSDFMLSSLNYVSFDTLNEKNWNTTEPMSIITAKIGEAMKKNHRKINVDPCLIDNNMMALTVKKGHLKYFFYASKIIDFSWFSNPGAVPSLNHRQFRESYIMSPPIVDQHKIANYLDQKTSEIDTLIEDKEKLIALLEEKRQAIITEAVTKGLDPDVKMKVSGVEWIGEIPEHWDKTKIKFTTYVKGRIGWQGLRSDEFIDQGPYLVTGIDFKEGYVAWESCHHISEERYEEAKPIQLHENDLLITKDGTIGKVALVKNKPEKATLNSGIFVTRSLKGEYISEYMYWVLLSDIFKSYIDYMGTGSTIKHLYQETFINFSYPIPPIQEQQKINQFLQEYISELNSLVKKAYTQISKLKEYRQALIYEAVTGKIDVQVMLKETEQEEVSSS